MNAREGVTPSRPSPQPRPSSPEKPKPKSFTDPVKLDRAARIAQNALARAGLTLADLADREHVRAA